MTHKIAKGGKKTGGQGQPGFIRHRKQSIQEQHVSGKSTLIRCLLGISVCVRWKSGGGSEEGGRGERRVG